MPMTRPQTEITKKSVYWKVTNKEEFHHSYQYTDGPNILTEKFNDNNYEPDSAGGFYFTDFDNIHNYLCLGVNLREIYLPEENVNFKKLKLCGFSNDLSIQPSGNKWRANMLILGKKYLLSDPTIYSTLCLDQYPLFLDAWYKWACENGCLDIVKFLFGKEFGPRIQDHSRFLGYASVSGHIDIVKFLVENGVDLHAYFNYALRMASMKNHLDIVKYLLGKGANVHELDDDALKLGCQFGNLEIVDLLIKSGADFNNGYGHCLKISIENKHFKVAKLLVGLGIDISEYGGLALIHATASNHFDLVKMLVEKKVNVQVWNNVPVQNAYKNKNLEMVEFLVKNGADISMSH